MNRANNSEAMAQAEQKEFNRRDRELRYERMRRMLDEGLPASTIALRLGLSGTERRSIKKLKEICGWKPKEQR